MVKSWVCARDVWKYLFFYIILQLDVLSTNSNHLLQLLPLISGSSSSPSSSLSPSLTQDFTQEFSTGCVFWHSGAYMVWHRHTSQRHSTYPLTWMFVADSDPWVRQHLSYHPLADQLFGDRAFPVAAARAWNSLPPSVRSTPSLASFYLHLKTHLFAALFPRWLSSPS